MKTGKFNARHHGTPGPGGWDCTCCGPSPKHRALFARLLKKRIYRKMDKEETKNNT